VSPPIVTPFGLHLIECTDIKPGDKTWQQVRDVLAPAIAKSTFRRLADEVRSTVAVNYTGALPHLDSRTGRLVPARM
jgi:parvulin-like peptidyl-prolyl isomerase